MRVNDGQNSQLLAQGKLVVNKVHCPDIVRPNGLGAIFP